MIAALSAVWTNKTLWLAHVGANAALLAAVYGWLWIPDRTALDVILSAASALAILLFASWLHSGTMEYFRQCHGTGRPKLGAAFKPSIRRTIVFAVWLVALLAFVVLALQLRRYVTPASNWAASALTFNVQRPVTPDSVAGILSALVGIVAFAVVPFLMLQFWKWKWNPRYLLTYVLLFLTAVYIPYRLIWWVPPLTGLYAQTASLALRFIAAYLLAVTGWLFLASMIGRFRSAG